MEPRFNNKGPAINSPFTQILNLLAQLKKKVIQKNTLNNQRPQSLNSTANDLQILGYELIDFVRFGKDDTKKFSYLEPYIKNFTPEQRTQLETFINHFFIDTLGVFVMEPEHILRRIQ